MLGLVVVFCFLAVLGILCLIGAAVCVRWLYRRMNGPRPEAPSGEASPSFPPAPVPEPSSVTDEAFPRPEPGLNADSSGVAGAVAVASADIPFQLSGAAMPEPESLPPRGQAARIMRDPLVRFAIVAVIALALLIPLALVGSLVDERAGLYRDVVEDISRTWGGRQTLAGPFLLIPYTERRMTTRAVPDPASGPGAYKEVPDSYLVTNHLVLLPERVDFSGVLQPEERQRGIYRSLVYTAGVNLSGRFVLPTADALERVAPALQDVDYARAFVIMGLSWPSALRSAGAFVWNGAELTAEPGTQPFAFLRDGFRVPVRLSPSRQEYRFEQKLSFNGSQGLSFMPVGGVTDVALTSSWPHPSFQGSVLPASREVRADGFTASWSIPALARSFPNLDKADGWKSRSADFTAGVDLYESGTHYQLIERSVKYGVLFIGLTFLAFVVFELSLRARLHPVQYGLIGLSMVVFYLVLLSLSEHLSFGLSYAAASACTVLMIAAYAAAALRSPRRGGGAGLLLATLYTLLYGILQLEDYALLMGTALVLIMLAALMLATRRLACDGDRG